MSYNVHLPKNLYLVCNNLFDTLNRFYKMDNFCSFCKMECNNFGKTEYNFCSFCKMDNFYNNYLHKFHYFYNIHLPSQHVQV